MITLDAGKYLYMTSTSGGVCYATVEGMELNTSTGVETYKVLTATSATVTAVVIPSATSTVNYIYVTPATTSAFIKSMFIISNGAGDEVVSIYLSSTNSTAAANEIAQVIIPASGAAFYGGEGWQIYDSQGTPIGTSRGITTLNLGGNTAGVMASISSGTITLAGTNGITLSQNANSITVSQYDQPMTYYDNLATGGTSFTNPILFQSLQVFPIIAQQFFPAPMTVNSLWLDMTGNITTTGPTQTASQMTIVLRVGLYTVNGNSLSLLNSAAKTLFQTNNTMSLTADLSSSLYGNRWLQLTAGDWSAGALNLNYSRYYLALNWAISHSNTTSSNALGSNCSMSMWGQSYWNTLARSGFAGTTERSANVTTAGIHPFWGIVNTTTNGIPAFICMTDINKQSASGNFMPHIILNNLTASI